MDPELNLTVPAEQLGLDRGEIMRRELERLFAGEPVSSPAIQPAAPA